MVDDLNVKIGADASDLIDETKKASKAFDNFADSVEEATRGVAKSSNKARDAFGRYVKRTEDGARKTKKATSAFNRMGTSLKKLGARLKKIKVADVTAKLSGGFSGLVSIIGTATKALAVFGVGLAAVGTAAAVSFAKFENKFAQVRTLVDESLVDVDSLADGVRKLAVAFGVDALEATEAAYQAISAGQDPATVLKFLEESFKGAAAGAGSTSEAVDAGTTILNAFGKAAGGVSNTFNVLFATIKAGKTTLPELAASIGQVAPVAASAGVSLEETAAAIATLTASGLNTAESATALKATLVGLIKPAGAAEKALLGIGVSAATLRDAGLTDAITKVRAAVAAGNGALTDFFPNVRALVGVATLAGEGFEKFGTSLKSTENAVGAAGEAFDKTASTTSFAFSSLRRTVEDTFRSVGKAIDPFIKRGIGAFQEFASNAQSEIEVLGKVLLDKFAPQVSKAFGLLEDSAGESGDLATKALETVSSAFDFVGKQIRKAGPLIGGVVATFETLADVVKLAGNAIRFGYGVALTHVAEAMTAAIQIGASFVSFFSDDLGRSIQDVADISKAFSDGLREETVGAFEDTIAAAKDVADVADVMDATSKSVQKFGLNVRRAGSAVNELKEDVGDARELKAMRAASKDAADAAGELERRTKAGLEAQVKAKPVAEDLGSATRELGTASNEAATGVDKLASSFAKANAGSSEFVAKLKTISEAIAGIGGAQTAEQGIEARQEAIVALIGAADAALEGALDAARARAQKLNADAKANLDAAKAAELEAVKSRDRGAITEAGAAVSQAQKDLAATVRVSNALFADQKAVAVDAYEKVRAEINLTEGAAALLRDNTIANAKKAGSDQITAARDTFKAERRALIDSLKANEIDRATFAKKSIALNEELSRATTQASDSFDRIREKANAAFDLETETQSVNDLVGALTGDLAAAVEQAREDAETYGFSQMELNEALRGIAGQAVETGDAFAELGDKAEKSKGSLDGAAGAVEKLGTAIDNVKAGGGFVEGEAFTAGLKALNLTAEETANVLTRVGNTSFSELGEKAVPLNAKLAELAIDGFGGVATSVEELGKKLDASGKAKIAELGSELAAEQISLEMFGAGLIAIAEDAGITGKALDELIEAFKRAGDAAEESAARQARAFGTVDRSASESQSSVNERFAGASFGTQRVTGSSNFESKQAKELGDALGLGPKALRSRAKRTQGGLAGLQAQVDAQFVDGGPVTKSGRAQVEAGEFVLSQRGLSDLGRVLGDLLNRGRGGTVINQTNQFSVAGQLGSQGSDSINELAFKLRPALFRTGRLAAAKSPVT